MKKWCALLFPSALILAAMGCGQSSKVDPYVEVHRAVEPVIFYTSLADTLPAKTHAALKVGNVMGIKIRDLQGHDIRYFQYQADVSTVLKCLSLMPFNKHHPVADTVCRKISYQELRFSTGDVSLTELNSTSFFTAANQSGFEIYECIKSPQTHHILIDKTTGTVFHRVAQTA